MFPSCFTCCPSFLHVAQVAQIGKDRSELHKLSPPFPHCNAMQCNAMQCARLCCNAAFHNALHLYFALHHIVRLQLALKIELPSPSATQCFVLNCRTFICSAPKLGQPHFWVHWTRVEVYTARFFSSERCSTPHLTRIPSHPLIAPRCYIRLKRVISSVSVCLCECVCKFPCLFVCVCVLFCVLFVVLWVCVVCTIECSQLLASLPFKCQSDRPSPPTSPFFIIIIVVVAVLIRSFIVFVDRQIVLVKDLKCQNMQLGWKQIVRSRTSWAESECRCCSEVSLSNLLLLNRATSNLFKLLAVGNQRCVWCNVQGVFFPLVPPRKVSSTNKLI